MGVKQIIFMGEKPLGLMCLRLLHRMPEVDVVAVCTRARKEVWWGKQEILDYCRENDIPIIKRVQILDCVVDHLISVLYPFVIEPEYIRHAQRGCYNLHEAPLPRWRGCNSYSHALLAGDETYGTTLHELTPKLDEGSIIAERRFPIKPFETAKELYERTTLQSYQLAEEWFPRIINGNLTPHTAPINDGFFLNQRDSLADLKYIPPGTSISDALPKIAALDFVPWEPAFTRFHGKNYYLFFESSSGRKCYRPRQMRVHDAPARLSDLAWGTFEVCIVRGIPRSIVICKEDLYKEKFPLWATGK